MKKLTAEEKLAILYEKPALHTQEVRGAIECPYGDTTHHPVRGLNCPDETAEQHCYSCSSIDGSECVDELLATWEGIRGLYKNNAPIPTCEHGRYGQAISELFERIDIVREWRASKGKP